MGKVLAFINQKGGVGKTTSAVNVGLSLAVSEIKTLIVDLDPQANATIGLSDLTEKSEKKIQNWKSKGQGAHKLPFGRKESPSCKRSLVENERNCFFIKNFL